MNEIYLFFLVVSAIVWIFACVIHGLTAIDYGDRHDYRKFLGVLFFGFVAVILWPVAVVGFVVYAFKQAFWGY